MQSICLDLLVIYSAFTCEVLKTRHRHICLWRVTFYSVDKNISSGISTGAEADKRIGQALRNLLCGARPYVSIGWCSAICFYCVVLGHMFLLCGAKPYVSIMWR